MEVALTRLVWLRAKHCCEYCQLFQEYDDRPFEIDHITSRKQRGQSVASNLALSCFRCNRFKGSDISARDRITGKLVPLFNPRSTSGRDTFGGKAHISWRTATGNVTVDMLNINDPLRVDFRAELIEEGLFRPV